MSSSLTLNAATWIPGLYTTLLHHFQLSASLDEKLTLMEVLTSTLSWISGERSTSETLDDSMLRASTRMYNHAVAHRKRCSTMRSRTETLSQEDSVPSSTIMFRQLVTSGLESHMRQLWTNFGTLFESWHRERFVATSTPSEPMPNGTIDPRLLHTSTPRPFDLALREFQSSMNGYVTICLELVSDCLARRPMLPRPINGAPRGSLPKGPLPPRGRGLEGARV